MLLRWFVIAATLALTPNATPVTVRDTLDAPASNEYAELYRRKASLSDGHLVYYGHNERSLTPRSDSNDLEKRASCSNSGSLTCSTDYPALTEYCDYLVQELQADYNVPVGTSPRQICYLGLGDSNHQYCCVSWSDPVPNLIKGWLYPAAESSRQ
jgi:hypothetical protein